MGGVTEIAGTMLSRAFMHAEIAAQNLSNLTTPGYKAKKLFSGLLTDDDQPKVVQSSIDFSSGSLQNTGDPFNLAISGSGFFAVSSGKDTLYTRDGQFVRGRDGRVLTAGGLALQSAAGGDVIVSQNNPQILQDGTVLENGQPVARIGLANFSNLASLRPQGDGLFSTSTSSDATASGQIHQGMIETSNVSTADEMISIMASLRSAESGQKVVQVYDDLMARALNSFGQS